MLRNEIKSYLWLFLGTVPKCWSFSKLISHSKSLVLKMFSSGDVKINSEGIIYPRSSRRQNELLVYFVFCIEILFKIAYMLYLHEISS